MALPPRKRRLSPEQRRALKFLVSNPVGATAALMLSQGVPRRTLASLVRAGLAIARHQSVEAGGSMAANSAAVAVISCAKPRQSDLSCASRPAVSAIP
jgi:hypothetical protein